MRQVIGFYPRPDIDTVGTQVVSQAGTVLPPDERARGTASGGIRWAIDFFHPQLGSSRAIRTTNNAIASLIGGRPGMFG